MRAFQKTKKIIYFFISLKLLNESNRRLYDVEDKSLEIQVLSFHDYRSNKTMCVFFSYSYQTSYLTPSMTSSLFAVYYFLWK